MTVSIFQRVQVKDFESWLHPNPDQVAENMKGLGALSFHLTRNLDDPNALMIHFQFPDETTAQSFKDSYQKAVEQRNEQSPDGAQDIQEWWFGMDVEGYCREV